MAICQNCGAAITCGCQQRTASDGTPTCQICLEEYEQQLIQQRSAQQQVQAEAEWAYKFINN